MLFMDLLSRFIDADGHNSGREITVGDKRVRIHCKLRIPQLIFEGVVSEVDKVIM